MYLYRKVRRADGCVLPAKWRKKIDTMSAKTLFEHDDHRYNGFTV